MIGDLQLAVEDTKDLGPLHPGLALEVTAFGDLKRFAIGQVGLHGALHNQLLAGGDLPG